MVGEFVTQTMQTYVFEVIVQFLIMFLLEFCGEELFFFKVPFEMGKHDLVNFLHYFRSSSLCLAGVEKKRKTTLKE